MITARPATINDAARLFCWRNDGETKSNSTSTEDVSWTRHCLWLNKTLADSRIELYIAHDSARGAYIGTYRLDRVVSGAIVSVTVDAQQRGRGYAAAMIELAVQSNPGVLLKALVKERNHASLRAFWALGFRGEVSEDGLIALERQP